MERGKKIIGRIASAAIAAGGWILAGMRGILDLVGYATVPDDAKIAEGVLSKFIVWLLDLPWFVPWGFAFFSTALLIWISWPRPKETVIVQPQPDLPPPPPVHTQNPSTRNFFSNEEIRVWDLPTAGSHIIRNRVFQDCVFVGPVIISFGDHTHMDQITFETEDFESHLIEIPAGRLVAGVYGFISCRFDRCRFVKVGIMGTDETLNLLRQQFSLSMRAAGHSRQ